MASTKRSMAQTKAARKIKHVEESLGVKLHPDLARYTKVKVGDRAVIDVGDETAIELRELSIPDVAKLVAREMKAAGRDATADGLLKKYSHLNPGMQRMNLGNILRGLRHAGEDKAITKKPKVKAKVAAPKVKAHKVTKHKAEASLDA